MAVLREEVRHVATGETKRKWAEENVVRINLNLNKTYDADILDAIARVSNAESKGAAVKFLLRSGIELDKKAGR